MPLPSFLCVGAQKAGTSTLHDILIQHPDVFLPSTKETCFFRDDDKYAAGLEYYEKEFFSRARGERAIGEIAPDYMYFDYVPERVYASLGPDLKIIFMLRNPVDRAYSHYCMSHYRGYDSEPFARSIELESDRIRRGFPERNHLSYLDRGRYAEQIQRFLRFYPMENMLFLVFEEEFKDLQSRAQSISGILRFLSVQVLDLDVNLRSNPSSRPRYTLIRNIIHGRPALLRYLGRVLVPSKKLKAQLLLLLDRKNRIESKPPELPAALRQTIWDRHFKQTVEELEVLLRRDLRCWYPPDPDST